MIILHLDSCDSDIKYALDNFLREKGFSVEHHDIGKLCFLNAVAGASAIEQPPAEQPVEEPSVDPGTMPSPSADLPAYEPEVDLQVQAPDEVTNVPSPEPLAKHYVSGELIVRNLSAECKIPFDINPDNYMAKVTLDICKNIKLPEDTVAEIVSEGFMGARYIALVPGGSDQKLNPGETIEFTQSAISFESLISRFIFNSNDKNKSVSAMVCSSHCHKGSGAMMVKGWVRLFRPALAKMPGKP